MADYRERIGKNKEGTQTGAVLAPIGGGGGGGGDSDDDDGGSGGGGSGAPSDGPQPDPGYDYDDDDGGGGGGGGGGGSYNPDPPDESRVDISHVDASSQGAGSVRVSYKVSNVITSGDGEDKNVTVAIKVDGDTVDSESISTDDGSVYNRTVDLNGLESGNRTICVEKE